DLATVEPSLAGPKRPQDRVPLSMARQSFQSALPSLIKPKAAAKATDPTASATNQEVRWEAEGGYSTAVGVGDRQVEEHVSADVKNALRHGSVVISAITSCTNTSNQIGRASCRERV